MSKAEKKPTDDNPDDKILVDDTQLVRRLARTAKIEDQEFAEKMVADWRASDLFIKPESDNGRRLTPKMREDADLVVALCLVRLGQAGMSEDAMKAPARLCCELLMSDKSKGGDLWLVLASEDMPQAIADRMKLIDFLGRTKGQAVVVLDVAGVIRTVRT